MEWKPRSITMGLGMSRKLFFEKWVIRIKPSRTKGTFYQLVKLLNFAIMLSACLWMD